MSSGYYPTLQQQGYYPPQQYHHHQQHQHYHQQQPYFDDDDNEHYHEEEEEEEEEEELRRQNAERQAAIAAEQRRKKREQAFKKKHVFTPDWVTRPPGFGELDDVSPGKKKYDLVMPKNQQQIEAARAAGRALMKDVDQKMRKLAKKQEEEEEAKKKQTTVASTGDAAGCTEDGAVDLVKKAESLYFPGAVLLEQGSVSSFLRQEEGENGDDVALFEAVVMAGSKKHKSKKHKKDLGEQEDKQQASVPKERSGVGDEAV